MRSEPLDYAAFLQTKSQADIYTGFEPIEIPDFLFDFQKAIVDWAIRKGKAAIFADCGLGKTPMQLVWADNVIRKTNHPVLILTPLAVGSQTMKEGDKFGIACERSRDGLYWHQGIVITNYEKLHLFNSSDFAGVVCDESSILKHFSGATQQAVTRFMAKIPYRLLCTATAAPNDYIELGTSSDALGELGYSDMLSLFFRQTDNKPHCREDIKQWQKEKLSNHYMKLAFRISQQIGQWRLKGHAELPFWRWVASWARACRKPSDLGFDDDGFILPPLIEREHVIEPTRPADGLLFVVPAIGLNEERDERRRTLDERCQRVAALVDHSDPAIVWCHLNIEGDRLERIIPGSVQIQGSDNDNKREDAYIAFGDGSLRVLIIKPKIGAWGMNWQHCNHVVTFASHSYEQFYQSVRRCWRFGQTRCVTVDIISTTGECRVRENMSRKAEAADKMFTELISHMNEATRIKRTSSDITDVRVPAWL